MKKNLDYYQPIFDQIGFTKPVKIIYYELRIWKHHNIIEQSVFTTKKDAMIYYETNKLAELEEKNDCFVEITKIENINPRYN